MKPKHKKLKNGLSVITVPMKDNPTVTVFVAVAAGSNYETEKNNGISHFLEHMVFKGTEKRPHAREISYELEKVGATHNAFTGNEYTGYYAKATKKHYKKILELIGDMYLNPIFDKGELKKEKGVIIEEINMYEDLSARHVAEVLDSLMYKNQPAGRTILGPKKNIKNMKRGDFILYRKQHYIPKATTVVVAGNVNETQVHKDVAKMFGSMDSGPKGKKDSVRTTQRRPQVAIKFKKIDQAHILIAFRTQDSSSCGLIFVH